LEIAPDIDVRGAKIKAKADSTGQSGTTQPARVSFDFNSNFTVTGGYACHHGVMREPLQHRGSFETD
jgi:hypothetical protein